MLKKYRVYFKEGYQASKNTLKNKGNFLRYYLIYLIDLLGTVLFPLKPITSMAVYRMLKMGASGNDFSIIKASASADNPKSYWSLMWAVVLKFMMVLAGVLVLAIITVALFFLGSSINIAFPNTMSILPFLISAPGAICAVAFLLVVIFTTMPLSYIINNNLSIGTSRALHKSVNAFKHGGKKQYIAILITKALLSIVYYAVGVIITIILINSFRYEFENLILMLCIIVFVSVYIIFITKINLAFDFAKINLLDDVLYDKVLGEKKYTGIKLENVSESKKLNKLERLFETDAVMISDNKFDLIRSLRDINGTNTDIVDSEEQIMESPQTEEVVSGPVVESVIVDEEVQAYAEDADSSLSEEQPLENPLVADEEVQAYVEEADSSLSEELPLENPLVIDEEVEEADSLSSKDALEDVSSKKEKVSFMDKLKKGFKNMIPSKKANKESIEAEASKDNEIKEDLSLENPEVITKLDETINEAVVEEAKTLEKDEFINPIDIEKALAIEEPQILTEEEKIELESQAQAEALFEEEIVEEIIYVDEDGNPVQISDDQEIIEEIIYVDENGNPIEIDENIEIVEEVTEEKPKRGRKKKTVEDGE